VDGACEIPFQRGDRRYASYVFTEPGAVMLASVCTVEGPPRLRSEILRAFARPHTEEARTLSRRRPGGFTDYSPRSGTRPRSCQANSRLSETESEGIDCESPKLKRETSHP
jgi:hypothetical protein